MGFLNFLKRGDGKKQELSPPTNPDSSLASPLPDSNRNLNTDLSTGSANNMKTDDFSLNNQTSQLNNVATTDIPKPPLSDDYDIMHSDDDFGDTEPSQGSQMPQDDFGEPIQHSTTMDEQSIKQEPSEEFGQPSQPSQQSQSSKEDDKEDIDVNDIDDDLPDFDQQEMEEAKTLESSNNNPPSTHADLPVFENAEEISEDEIHSYMREGDNKELYVSADSYQKTIDLVKNLKKSARKFDSGIKKVKESMNAEKEIFERFTTSLKLAQQNLLSMDNKFLKR